MVVEFAYIHLCAVGAGLNVKQVSKTALQVGGLTEFLDTGLKAEILWERNDLYC